MRVGSFQERGRVSRSLVFESVLGLCFQESSGLELHSVVGLCFRTLLLASIWAELGVLRGSFAYTVCISAVSSIRCCDSST